MIQRIVQQQVATYLQGNDHKIFFIWGPRRSGKTTLLKELSRELSVPRFNFDFQSDREFFEPTKDALKKIASAHSVILIDEVQSYPESTVALKLLYDEFNVKIIATGSSELRQKSKDFDSLAGRFTEHYCLPLSIAEISDNEAVSAHEQPNFETNLQNNLQIYGAYPEIYANTELSEQGRIGLLQTILDSYVLKDVIDIYNLKNSKLAKDILTKIALQIGQEVSVGEIARSLGANQSTVSSYIEIYIKNYILIPLPAFKTNARRAVSENRKLYFYDLGIRNILVKDFRELDLRPDKGGVFENFIVSEIEKKRRNTNAQTLMYFYREYSGQEVDIVLEDYKKNYTALEVKSNTRARSKDIFPLPHSFEVINNANYFKAIEDMFSR
ncbi:MAG TPA: ATP-binding protein [Candidatus Dormibacteraeota bacterium]|nr:ATP-binding protein [Candidatus Dormibacteraeota bacterium]